MNPPPPPLRVVHIVSADQWAGAEVLVWHLVKHLGENPGCEVSVICLNEGTLASKLRASGIEVVLLDERSLRFSGIVRAAARAIGTRRVDVFHSHRYKEHLLAALLAWRYGGSLVATVHGFPEPVRQRRLWYWLQSRGTMSLLRWRFDAVVAVSRAMEQRLAAEYGTPRSQLRTIANGIVVPPPAPMRPFAGQRELHIGSVGRLVPVKRFDLFLEVAARVRDAIGSVRFSILGAGPDRAALQDKALALGLQDVFAFAEPTPDPSHYYSSLDIYLNTSASEGLPLSLLEAMSFGVPVVAAAVGGIPEVVRHDTDGLLIHSSDPGAFAAACVAVAQDRDFRCRLSSSARERVRSRYSADTMASEYLALYRQLAAGRIGQPGWLEFAPPPQKGTR